MQRLRAPRAAGTIGLAAAALAFAGLAVPAGAADPGQADAGRVAHGRQLSDALCATCHLRGNDADKVGDSGIPGFRAVAKRPGQTHANIVEWLLSVPPMMPNHRLTQDEAASLAAYILTLRGG